ncbi:MAG: DUF916 domain-containing protein [Patescibacteria group bacterium]
MAKNLKFIILTSVLFFAQVFYFGLFSVEQAEAAQGFTIFPAKVSLSIDKGTEQSSWIRVTNAGDAKVGVLVSIQDMVPTANSGGFNYVPKAPGITSLVDWIAIDKKVFSLNPNESKEVPFAIKVPADASPGSRFAIVFFATGDPAGEKGQLNVSARVGALVFLTVPGDFRQTGEILDFRTNNKFIFQKEPISFKFDFQNTGTVYFEPKGAITITNIFGQTVDTIPVEGQVVLPTGLRTLTIAWPYGGWLFGIYKAHLAISVTGKGDIAAADTTIYAFPIIPSLGALGVLIILILLFWYIKKNFKFAIVKKE